MNKLNANEIVKTAASWLDICLYIQFLILCVLV